MASHDVASIPGPTKRPRMKRRGARQHTRRNTRQVTGVGVVMGGATRQCG
jgi:hypothetical protein